MMTDAEMEAQEIAEQEPRLVQIAARLGCPGNLKLAEYVESLEDRLADLESEASQAFKSIEGLSAIVAELAMKCEPPARFNP